MTISKPLIEATKELGRVAVLAFIPLLIVALQTRTFDWYYIAITVAIAVLRAIDKLMHEMGKENPDNKRLLGGLTGF